MLDNIKSVYFLRSIFSSIYEKTKLKVVIYNKNIQNKLDINITYYKFFSGKYKIVDKNGNVKVFNGSNDLLIFEGKYLKGKRNGFGREYDNDGLLAFEGEYLNGEKNGKGREYHYNGKIAFEGEYLNGKRNGKGKEYGEFGHLIYEGEYLNGRRNGKGKEYENGEINFEGEYLNGKRKIQEESNTISIDTNILFIDYFEDGEIKYEGNSINGLKNGKGKEYYRDHSLKFEGEYLYDKK